jgi:uncharacterized membrane protein YdbT with pleckstrin-like domain
MAQSYLESLLSQHERIVLTTRQHWFILLSSIFVEITIILIIFAVAVTAAIFFPPYALVIVALGFVLILIPIASMTHDILNWTHRQYIVTNRRVMQISGILNKNVTDSSLEKVNDVKMEQSALGRMFDYGDIEILTASELGVNLFKRIENPIKFKTAMLNAKVQLERGEEDVRPASNIPALITQLDQLRQKGVLSEEEFQQKKAQLLSKL